MTSTFTRLPEDQKKNTHTHTPTSKTATINGESWPRMDILVGIKGVLYANLNIQPRDFFTSTR